MKISAVTTLAWVCSISLALVLPSYADSSVSGIPEQARIGIALPGHTAEAALLKQALETRGFDTILYTAQNGEQVPQMLDDGCNLIVSGAANGFVLDERMAQAAAAGMEIAAYGSVLLNPGAAEEELLQSSGAVITSGDVSTLSRIELFSGVTAGAQEGSEIYSALAEINPGIEHEAVLARSRHSGHGILDRALDDSRSMIAGNVDAR